MNQISTGNLLSDSIPAGPYPTGVDAPFPNDVFLHIVQLFTPEELNSICLVCKSWYSIISDRKIWVKFLANHQHQSLNSLIFAESRLGKRSRSHLSYQKIYNQRQKMTETLVIDFGNFVSKIGSSKNAAPSVYLDSFIMQPTEYEMPFRERMHRFLTDAYIRMSMLPSQNSLLISLPICCFPYDTIKDDMNSIFAELRIPSICMIRKSCVALFSSNHLSGILVDIGFLETRVSPIFRGELDEYIGEVVAKVGGVDLNKYLKEQLININLPLLSPVWTTVKEDMCYVALDYEKELNTNVENKYITTDQGIFVLQKQRFQAAEVLFKPGIAGSVSLGLHHAVAGCIGRSQFNTKGSDSRWFKTIVLTGGTSLLPGLAERLKKELIALLPPSLSEGICVIPSPAGGDAVWQGSKLVSSVSTFQEQWCKDRY